MSHVEISNKSDLYFSYHQDDEIIVIGRDSDEVRAYLEEYVDEDQQNEIESGHASTIAAKWLMFSANYEVHIV